MCPPLDVLLVLRSAPRFVGLLKTQERTQNQEADRASSTFAHARARSLSPESQPRVLPLLLSRVVVHGPDVRQALSHQVEARLRCLDSRRVQPATEAAKEPSALLVAAALGVGLDRAQNARPNEHGVNGRRPRRIILRKRNM